jgi:hypothetical protein
MLLGALVLLASAPSALGVGRVIPLLEGDHLDDLLRDTRSNRPASLFAIYSSTFEPCVAAWRGQGFDAAFSKRGDKSFPARAHLLLGKVMARVQGSTAPVNVCAVTASSRKKTEEVSPRFHTQEESCSPERTTGHVSPTHNHGKCTRTPPSAQFDLASLEDVWWREPDPRRLDLGARFNATMCPALVYLPPAASVSQHAPRIGRESEGVEVRQVSFVVAVVAVVAVVTRAHHLSPASLSSVVLPNRREPTTRRRHHRPPGRATHE